MTDLFDRAKKGEMVCTYNITITPERDLLHRNIIKKFIKPTSDSKNKWFIFTAGCFGSGKSHVMKYLHNNKKINLDDYVFVDPDELRYEIPEIHKYIKEDPYTAGLKTHSEACYLSDLLISASLIENKNIISDGSMQNYFWYKNNFIPYLRKNFPHYKLAIIFVTADLDIVIDRCDKRGEKTGRMIKHDVIEATYNKVKISYEQLSPLVDLSYIVENNTNPNIEEIEFTK